MSFPPLSDKVTMRLPFLLCLIAFVISLGGCFDDTSERAAPDDILAKVTAAKTVRIGVKTNTPPFSVMAKDGSYSGFDIDIAEALAKQMGIDTIAYVPVTSADRIVKLMHGDVDMVIASMTITRYREHRVDFSLPYFQDGESLLVKKDSPVDSYLDLTGKTVGCLKGSTSSYYMKQVAPGCMTKVYMDAATMMAGLMAGDVDAVTSDELILIGLIKQSTDPSALRIAGKRFTTEPYGIALAQNQSHWRNAIDDALQTLWENGTWQAIADSWFGPGAKYQTDLAFAIKPYPH